MLNLLKKLKPYQVSLILLAVLLIAGQVYLDLMLPDFLTEITKSVQDPINGRETIWINGGYMLSCALGSALLSVVTGFISSYVAAGFSKNVRKDLFNKIINFSMEEIQTFSTPSLITRSTNDITQVQSFIAMGLQILVKGPILAVWATIKILGKSWQWSAATAIAVLFLFILITLLVVFALPKFKQIQNLTDDLNNDTRENLTGIRVVRAFNAEKYQEGKFEKTNNNLTKNNLFTSRMMSLISPGMNLITGGLNLAIYWIGAYLVERAVFLDKIIVFSDMVVFSSYAMQIVFAFVMMTMIFLSLPRASVSAKRINEVLKTDTKIFDGTLKTNSIKGEIQFKNVSFKYPDADEYILKNINLNLKQGETVAFIGSTGSGKSTLINLLPRFYDVTDGELLIDQINVKDYSLFDLRSKLGYISQKAVLFKGTIESNLLFGETNNPAPSNDELNKSIKISQSGFINKLENQAQSVVTENGTNYSGGQKQRLSIARAIARNPEIFIFDDSFSALDYKTDLKLRQALQKNNKNTTTLIVAQRIGTIKQADKIVVLENGSIVGVGKHKTLLKNCKVYREIAKSQLSKEELS